MPPTSARTRRMTLARPAARWQDALPLGNGRIAAMPYGAIASEVILLNHKHLWVKRSKPTLPDISDQLPQLRALLARRQWTQAKSFIETRLREAGYPAQRPGAYQPLCDLLIETQTTGAFTHYRRDLDFETAIATVQWKDEGTPYRREIFVSRTRDVVALAQWSPQGAGVTCTLRLGPHDPAQIPRAPAEAGSDPGLTFQSSAAANTLALVGTFSNGESFGAAARVIARGGHVTSDGSAVSVRGADELVVLTTMFVFEDPRTALPRMEAFLRALGDYHHLRDEHANAHREIFNRTTVTIAPDDTDKTNEQLLLDGYNGNVAPELVQRMTDFGRHALICSTAAGAWPANLQGIWNGDYAPPWRSDYHNDENVQMNYWQALPGNLPESAAALADYYHQFLDDFRTNARCLYGARGVYIPISMTTHGHPGPGLWCNWTAAAGWLAQHFYDYYLFTGDRAFLADKAVPFMREVAAFYEDFLQPGPDGRLQFAPSLSPENVPPGEEFSAVLVNATMDVAVARELLTNLCDACEMLGVDSAGVARWRAMLRQLPPYEINPDGAIAEWIDPRLPDNYHHRHQSHLYPLFPGIEITAETDQALYDACRVAVEKRLVVGLSSQTGWSLAHMANIYARLGNGTRALQCIEYITRACTGPNLLTYHNDWRGQGLTLGYCGAPELFQIDANMGLTAAVMEMLVFSKPGLIKLLPALPAAWPRGNARGIRCRGALTVSLEWDVPENHFSATLTADTDQHVTVKLPPGAAPMPCDTEAARGTSCTREVPTGVPRATSCTPYASRGDAVQVDLPAGKAVAIAARWR